MLRFLFKAWQGKWKGKGKYFKLFKDLLCGVWIVFSGQIIFLQTMSKTLLEEYKASHSSLVNVRTNLNGFNGLLHNSNGFHTGLYDLSSCPGNIGKWDLIFDIILNLLQEEIDDSGAGGYKVLIIETYISIPWLKLKSDPRWDKERFTNKIKVVKIKTINELMLFFRIKSEESYFKNEENDFKFVLIDGFSFLYQKNLNELVHLNGITMTNNKSSSTSGSGDLDDDAEEVDKVIRNMKRDRAGNLVSYNPNLSNANANKRINSSKTINLIVHNFMISLKKLIDEHKVIVLTTGLMTSINQKFYKPNKKSKRENRDDNLDGKHDEFNTSYHNDKNNDFNDGNGGAEEEDEAKDECLNQPTLIPMLPLIGPWSSYYTNRIILYKDWYNPKTRSKSLVKLKSDDKLSVNLTIDYLSQFNSGDLQICLNYLIYSINNLNNLKEFRQGVFQVDRENNRIFEL